MKKLLLLLFLMLSSIYAKDYQAIKLVDMAQLVSNGTGRNIVISDTVQKDFSVYMPNFDWLDSKISVKLLFEILHVNQLSYKEFDNVILIYKELPKEEEIKLDEEKPILTPHVIKYQYLTLKELQPFLTSLYPDLKFSYLKNRVFFSSTEEDYSTIKTHIETLDSSYLQANLYFNVISTTNSLSKDIGTDFKMDIQETDRYIGLLTSSVKFETTLTDPRNFYAFINLLSSKGYSKLIQNPSATVRDGGETVLDSITSIPVLQATTSSSSTLATTQNTYKYDDVGLKLNITNVFITNDVFTFDLEINIESILDKSTTPTIAKKKLKTTISLKNNEPFIIAGLNSTDDVETITNIPIIEYIPIISKLTEHKTTLNKNETFTIVLNTDFFKNNIESVKE